jgi:hypothetical protein
MNLLLTVFFGILPWALGTGPYDALQTTVEDAPAPEDLLAWEPGFEGFGETGWRESTTPLCRSSGWAPSSYNLVWADSSGVSFISTGFGHPAGFAVFFNSGTGWTQTINYSTDGQPEEEEDLRLFGARISGSEGGPVWVCGDHGCLAIHPAEGTFDWVMGPDDAFIPYFVGPDLGYTLMRQAPVLVTYDGTTWSPFPGEPVPFDSTSFGAIWATDDTLFLGGANGTIVSNTNGRWSVQATHTLSYISDLYGNDAQDVWASTTDGQLLHYNGTVWESAAWENPGYDEQRCSVERDPIEQVQGAGGTIYARTDHALLRITQGVVEVVAYRAGFRAGFPESGGGRCIGGLTIDHMWVTSPNDVFLVVTERDTSTSECLERILHFDGSVFHWM